MLIATLYKVTTNVAIAAIVIVYFEMKFEVDFKITDHSQAGALFFLISSSHDLLIVACHVSIHRS